MDNNNSLAASKNFNDETPWEKMNGESAKAFSAFNVYKNLPPHLRSIKRAVTDLFGTPRQGKIRQWAVWSSKYTWVLRAGAWDQFLERQGQEEVISAVKEMNARHVRVAQAMQQKAIERLRDLQPIELSVQETLAFLSASTKLERVARGEPEEIKQTEMDVAVIDYSRLPPEEIQKILLRKLSSIPSNAIVETIIENE